MRLTLSSNKSLFLFDKSYKIAKYFMHCKDFFPLKVPRPRIYEFIAFSSLHWKRFIGFFFKINVHVYINIYIMCLCQYLKMLYRY